MRKAIYFFLITGILFVLAACSRDEASYESKSDDSSSDKEMSYVVSSDADEEAEREAVSEESSESTTETPIAATARMIIHRASLSVNVKELAKAQSLAARSRASRRRRVSSRLMNRLEAAR